MPTRTAGAGRNQPLRESSELARARCRKKGSRVGLGLAGMGISRGPGRAATEGKEAPPTGAEPDPADGLRAPGGGRHVHPQHRDPLQSGSNLLQQLAPCWEHVEMLLLGPAGPPATRGAAAPGLDPGHVGCAGPPRE